MDTFIVKYNGVEAARITGEGITPGKRAQYKKDSYDTETVEDDHLLRLQRDEKTILVFYISNMKNVEVEKVTG